ncbi:RBR-type E3 ubiquitin transferase [Ranunculus cassubicifolius]
MDLSELKNCSSSNPRLKEVRSIYKESELTEEQLTINNQLQQDELLALEAIYGDNLTILETDGQNSFQIAIHIEPPTEFTVSAKLHSRNENLAPSTSNAFDYSFQVEHLPPIVFTCLLPKSYPSHSPPLFTISVQWLDSVRVSSLCRALDSLWTDQPGQEVIYNCLDWLHTSSLTYLGIDKELVLGPYNTPDAEDERAISKSVSPDVDIRFMRNYNDDKCHEIFSASLHECCICCSKYAGTGFVRLPCKHFFCWKCMETYSRNHVMEEKLLCPDSKCEGLVPPGLLKPLLGKEEFERLESLLLQETLALMSDVVSCPRCQTACLEDVDHDAQCPKCLFSFCSLCREPRHVGITCISRDSNLQTVLYYFLFNFLNSTRFIQICKGLGGPKVPKLVCQNPNNHYRNKNQTNIMETKKQTKYSQNMISNTNTPLSLPIFHKYSTLSPKWLIKRELCNLIDGTLSKCNVDEIHLQNCVTLNWHIKATSFIRSLSHFGIRIRVPVSE